MNPSTFRSGWLFDLPTPPATAQPDAGEPGGGCGEHRTPQFRALIRHLIDTCTDPGELVVDAYAAAEVVMDTAQAAERYALGCVPDPALFATVAKPLIGMHRGRGAHEVGLRACLPDQMGSWLPNPCPPVALVVAAPPLLRPTVGQVNALTACAGCRPNTWDHSEGRFAMTLRAAFEALKPGGVLAYITPPRDERERVTDLAPESVRQCKDIGFIQARHVTALQRLRQDEPGGPAQPDLAGAVPELTAFAEVRMFTKPATTTAKPYRHGGRN